MPVPSLSHCSCLREPIVAFYLVIPESLVPLLRDVTKGPSPPLGFYRHVVGHIVRSDRWRYIKYSTGFEGLYDHTINPNEYTNLTGRYRSARTLCALSADEAPVIPRDPGLLRCQMVFDAAHICRLCLCRFTHTVGCLSLQITVLSVTAQILPYAAFRSARALRRHRTGRQDNAEESS
jgi:hypothetical protein